MPDEPIQGAQEATPEESTAPQEGTQEPDWQKRYEDMRSEFDRRGTRLQEADTAMQVYQALQDPESAPEVLKALGYDLKEQEPEEEYADPYDELRAEFDELKQSLTQREQQEYQSQLEEAEYEYIDTQLDSIEKEIGRKLDDDEAEVIGTLALQLRDDQRRPDVKSAYERIYSTILSKERERWVDSKKSAVQAPSGTPGQPEPDLDDPKARHSWIAEQLRARREQA